MSLAPNPLMDVLPTSQNDWREAVGKSALLVVDMQYYDAHPDYGLCRDLLAKGLQPEYTYYTGRLVTIVSRIKELLLAYRESARPVLYTTIESLVPDGADRCRRHKRVGIFVPPGAKEGEVIDELAPEHDEPVFKKTTASVFNSTTIDRVLRNMGIEQLTVCGVVTNGCVEGTIRDAADLSYDVFLVEDACAALTEDLHQGALRTLQHSYCTIVSASQVLEVMHSRSV